jgi:hypothetical protein
VFVLSNCPSHSSYSILVAPLRVYYVRAVLSGDFMTTYPLQARRKHVRRVRTAMHETSPAKAVPDAKPSRFTTDLSAYPPIPIYDSPEGERERRESERFDKALQRTLNSICRAC